MKRRSFINTASAFFGTLFLSPTKLFAKKEYYWDDEVLDIVKELLNSGKYENIRIGLEGFFNPVKFTDSLEFDNNYCQDHEHSAGIGAYELETWKRREVLHRCVVQLARTGTFGGKGKETVKIQGATATLRTSAGASELSADKIGYIVFKPSDTQHFADIKGNKVHFKHYTTRQLSKNEDPFVQKKWSKDDKWNNSFRFVGSVYKV